MSSTYAYWEENFPPPVSGSNETVMWKRGKEPVVLGVRDQTNCVRIGAAKAASMGKFSFLREVRPRVNGWRWIIIVERTHNLWKYCFQKPDIKSLNSTSLQLSATSGESATTATQTILQKRPQSFWILLSLRLSLFSTRSKTLYATVLPKVCASIHLPSVPELTEIQISTLLHIQMHEKQLHDFYI